jgi:hypothetical protein
VTYRFLADAVLLLHAAFVVFVAAGGLLVLRWPRLAWAHLPALAWGAWITLSGRICPLTPLENMLRQAGGQTGYPGGFIEHYIHALIYPAGLTRPTQVLLGGLALAVNVAVYAICWRRRRAGSFNSGRIK